MSMEFLTSICYSIIYSQYSLMHLNYVVYMLNKSLCVITSKYRLLSILYSFQTCRKKFDILFRLFSEEKLFVICISQITLRNYIQDDGDGISPGFIFFSYCHERYFQINVIRMLRFLRI